MPLAIAWWGWVIIVIVALLAFFVVAIGSFRRSTRRGFIAYLNANAPEFEIVEERSSALVLRNKNNGGEGPLYLDRLYDAISQLKPATPEAHREVYAHWLKILREGQAAGDTISVDTHGQRIFPRLITTQYFEELPSGREIPHRPLGDTGLFVAYVLDSENSVMYLTRPHLDDLKLDPDALHELALKNLRRITPPELLRNIVTKEGALNLVKTMDTYDAARILLLPEALDADRQVVAAVPDRDSLVVMPIPKDPDWDKLRNFPVVPGGDRLLLNRPLVVNKDGIRWI